MSDELVEWRGRNLSTPDAIMYYRGRLRIDPIYGSVDLADLDDSPALEEILHSGNYEVEIRVIRRLPRS
jgi:hypothetical protein